MKNCALINRIGRLYLVAVTAAEAATQQAVDIDRQSWLKERIARIFRAIGRELAVRGQYSWWSGTFFVPTSRGRHDVYRAVGRRCETGGVKGLQLEEWHPELLKLRERHPFPEDLRWAEKWPTTLIGSFRPRPEGTLRAGLMSKDIIPAPSGKVLLVVRDKKDSFWLISQEDFRKRSQWGNEMFVDPKKDQRWSPSAEEMATFRRFFYGSPDEGIAPIIRARGRR